MGAFRWKCALPGGAARILRPAREGFMGGHPAFGKNQFVFAEFFGAKANILRRGERLGMVRF